MKRLLFFLMCVLAFVRVWADNSVTVSYNGTTATVTVDDNVAQYLTVTQSGAHVSIVQSDAVTEEIIYTLSGTSSDGEFYMSGSFKATIELNGLSLTNTTPVYSGAAIHIQNGKRINVKVVTGTTNTLADAASGSQKGCLYVKGHAEFKQYGTLNIVGNAKHGIKAGEYVSVKNATINITSAVGDGISCNQYFLMESGTVNISGTGDDGIQCDLEGETATGITVNHEAEDSGNVYVSGGSITINCPATAAKGIKSAGSMFISDAAVIDITTTGHGEWDEEDLETNAACGLSADGNIDISGGTISLTATGSGGKGMSCDTLLSISGGNITVATSGGLYYNNGTTQNINYTGDTEQINSNYYSSPKGVKAGTKVTSGSTTSYYGGITISGGIISVTTTGNNAEGIESKNYLNISDGEVIVDAHDDGINSAQDLTITGGYVYSRGSNNDGIDANGNVIIQGGLIYAVGANTPEVAIDANTEENKKFYFSGGTLIAIGGLERGSDLSQTCYQSSSWSSNTWYVMTYGSTNIAFKTPSSGGSTLVLSATSTPSLKSGVTVNGGTSIFEGRCYLDATYSGGSNVSLSQYSSGGSGPNPPGPGQNTYTITATANPSEGGTVTGAGTYNRYANCTLTATANTGYTFVNWTKNGSVVSTNATYSFQVTSNASFVANFTLNSYNVTATANPTEGGSVTGTGTYNHGTTATLTAVANDNYTFVNWTKNGSEVSTNATYSFQVTSNVSLVANFEEAGPVIPEEGAYLTVENITPDIIPVNQRTNLSLSMKNIGVDPTSGVTTVSLTCDDDRLEIVDGFEEFGVLPADGTVTLQDAFNVFITEGVADGTEFQIDVEMSCGLDNWTGTVTVTAALAVLEYQGLTWDGNFVPGETISLTAKFKNTGSYQATNAEVTMSSSSNYITISNPTVAVGTIAVDQEVSCVFNATIAANCPETEQIPVTFTLTANGDLTAQGDEVLGNSCVVVFDLVDSYGDGWNGNVLTVSFDDGSPSQELTITSGKTASYSIEIGNGVHVTLSWTTGNYAYECSFSVKYEEGDLVIYQSSGTPSAGVLHEFDCNCGAASAVFNVVVSSSNTAQGTVEGGGEFGYGESCTVSATPSDGYMFAGWTENGTVVSGVNPYTFAVYDDHNLVATFAEGLELGQSDANNNYLPSYSYYKQALSQQIYTADEIGTACTITSFAFYNEGAEKTRTYDFYLKHTDKQSFSSTTDWIQVTADDKVFSGSVTMMANGWTTIALSTPFEYDGTSNLVLVADDNTGSYSQSPHMSCSVYNTSNSQALYVYSDNTNYNPLSPPTSYSSYGETYAMLQVKNHIILTIETEAEPTVVQTTALSEGWNWFSTYIEMENPEEGLLMLEESLGENGIQIKNADYYTAYEEEEWFGDLDDEGITNEQMYKILVGADCVVVLEGAAADPSNHVITIVNGWNWIGFPRSEEAAIENALAGLDAEEGDMIKNNEYYSSFEDGEWFGDLEEMTPGQGYMYFSNSNSEKELVIQ